MFSSPTHLLSLGLESIRKAANVVGKVALVAEELNVGTVDLDLALFALLNVFLAAQRRETPIPGNDDLLTAGELDRVRTEERCKLTKCKRTLYWHRLRASSAVARCESLVRTDKRI